MSEPDPQPVPLRKAAKAVGVDYRTVRTKYVDAGRVRAYRWGGRDKAPRLRVYVGELRAAVEADRVYVPPLADKTPAPRVKRAALHPSALAALRDD